MRATTELAVGNIKLTPAGYEKNYKADFLTTKADVAKIRAGKMDEATF